MGRRIEPTDAEIANLKQLVLQVLQPLRDKLDCPVTITSGLRPDWLNKAIGGSKTSQHMVGEAADFQVAGMTTLEVCRAIMDLGLPYDQLIEEFGEWVHVSHSSFPAQRGAELTAYYDGGTRYKPGIGA